MCIYRTLHVITEGYGLTVAVFLQSDSPATHHGTTEVPGAASAAPSAAAEVAGLDVGGAEKGQGPDPGRGPQGQAPDARYNGHRFDPGASGACAAYAAAPCDTSTGVQPDGLRVGRKTAAMRVRIVAPVPQTGAARRLRGALVGRIAGPRRGCRATAANRGIHQGGMVEAGVHLRRLLLQRDALGSIPLSRARRNSENCGDDDLTGVCFH